MTGALAQRADLDLDLDETIAANSSPTGNRVPPVASVRVGSIQASIWRNTNDAGTFYSTKFRNSYKDKDGKWHDTDGFGPSDLLELAKAADKAHDKVLELQQGRGR